MSFWSYPLRRHEQSLSCRSPAVRDVSAQQIYFQDGWGHSSWQAGSSESSPDQAVLGSGDQPWASSTEHPKNKTQTVEFQFHFVQLDYWQHLGSKLGFWNNCKYPAVWKQYWKDPSVVWAWEQRDLYGTFNNHTKEELHGITLPEQRGWEGFLLPYGEDERNISETCFPFLSWLKKVNYHQQDFHSHMCC